MTSSSTSCTVLFIPLMHLLNVYSHRIAVKSHVKFFYIPLVLHMAIVIFLLKNPDV